MSPIHFNLKSITNLTADCTKDSDKDIALQTIGSIAFLPTTNFTVLLKKHAKRLNCDRPLFLEIHCPDCNFDFSDLFTGAFDHFDYTSSIPIRTIFNTIFHSLSASSLIASTTANHNQVFIFER